MGRPSNRSLTVAALTRAGAVAGYVTLIAKVNTEFFQHLI
jgi:hypothetical protein